MECCCPTRTPTSLERRSHACRPRPRRARGRRQGHHRSAGARAATRAYVFNTLLGDKATKAACGVPALAGLAHLANEASDESVQALSTRWPAARAGAALVPAQGPPARTRPPGLLDRMAPVSEAEDQIPTTRSARSCSTATRRSPPSSARPPASSSPTATSTALPAWQARRRVLLLHFPRAILRDAQTTPAAPRRAHEAHELGTGCTPRWPARRDLPVHHAAHDGRDCLDLRRDDRARAPAGARPRSGQRLSLLAGSLAARWPPCFARSHDRFEHAMHSAARHGELAPERFAELWLQTQADLLGTAGSCRRLRHLVVLRPPLPRRARIRLAYAYGHLLALSVYAVTRRPARASWTPISTAARRRFAAPRAAREIVGVD